MGKTPDKQKASEKSIKKQKATKPHHLQKSDILFIIFIIVWTFIALVASQFLVGLPMLWLLKEKFSQPLWTCIFYTLNYLLALVLIILLPPNLVKIWRRSHPNAHSKKLSQLDSTAEELGVDKWPTFVDIGLAPIGYVVYLVLSKFALNFMSIFPWFKADEAQDVGFSYFLNNGDRLIAMIALVLIAPLAEEIIMRGWLYGKLRSKLKIATAMILTSLVFAVLHGQWNVSVGVFMLSLVLCSLREVTGSIWSGVLLHILTNGISFYILYIAHF